MKEIRYHFREKATRVLGPGKRAAVWVSGCRKRCPGCIAEDFREDPGIPVSPEEMAAWYLSIPGAEGLTVSGGEPMLQAEALAEMTECIRKVRDTGLIVYTGYYLEELREMGKEDAGISRLLSLTDLLIDGPYVEAENHNEPYRGSANQHFYLLTDRYREVFPDYYLRKEGRNIELRFSHDRTVLLGIPSADQAAIWRQLTKKGDGKR